MRDGSPRVMIRFNVMGPRVAARMVAARIGSTPRRAALAAATALAGVLLWTPASALAAPTVSISGNPGMVFREVGFSLTANVRGLEADEEVIGYSWSQAGSGTADHFDVPAGLSSIGAYIYDLTVRVRKTIPAPPPDPPDAPPGEPTIIETEYSASETVQVVNRPPNPTSFTVGASTNKTVTITPSVGVDPDGDSPVSYVWDFGDGTGATLPNNAVFTHHYAKKGAKTITLRIKDARGALSSETERTAGITNTQPVADFAPAPDIVKVGGKIQFVAGQGLGDPDGDSLTYSWSFGDGTTSTQAPPVEHQYNSVGPRLVTLKVDDGDGGTNTTTVLVTITDQNPPVASATFAPASPLQNEAIVLQSTSTAGDRPITAQSWDLDNDGDFDDASGPTATVTFSLPGTYLVYLRVEDGKYSPKVPITITVRAVPTVITPPVPVIPQGPAVQPPAARPTILSALVRISGTVVGGGVRVSQLRVTASAGTKVRVVCKGKGCVLTKRALRLSVAKARRLSKKTFNSTVSGKKGFVTFTSLKRKLYIGTTIEVYVTKPGTYGKFTRFTIRKGRSPLRKDACVDPTTSRATVCPAV